MMMIMIMTYDYGDNEGDDYDANDYMITMTRTMGPRKEPAF